MSTSRTAAEAFQAANGRNGHVNHLSSPFVCPFPECRVYAEHYWGSLTQVTLRTADALYQSRHLTGAELYVAKCSSCEREVVFLDGKMVKPATSEAPAPGEDMPPDIVADYIEAAAILPGSPRGSAALLRLAVQKLLPILGARAKNIDEQIGELVGKGVISSRVQGALDTLRVIGNEAVHPGTIDLKDDTDTAMSLFRLLNFIIEKAISEPKHADEMFAMLPQGKRDAIEERNRKATAKYETTKPGDAEA